MLGLVAIAVASLMIAIRPLFDADTADKLWQWRVDKDCSRHGSSQGFEDCITLERRVRFDVDVSRKIWPGIATPNQKIVISSLRTAANDHGDDEDDESAIPAILFSGLGVLGVLGIFWYAAGFIASRVLLMDVAEPHWMVRLPLCPTLGDHLFVFRRDKDIAALAADDVMGKRQPFLDVSFA